MTATNLVNDGNTTTNIVESTLLGSSGSNVTIKNDGTITIAEYISSTLTNLFQVITGTGLKLGAVGRSTEIIGNLLVDGTTTLTGAVTASAALTASSLTTTGAASVGSVASTGPITGSAITTTGAASVSKVNLTVGSITRITGGLTGSISGSGGTSTVTHTLGATPDFVLLTCATNAGTTQSLAATSLGTTTFVITNSAVSAVAVYWVAIKL
jgi:hypothetical protein